MHAMSCNWNNNNLTKSKQNFNSQKAKNEKQKIKWSYSYKVFKRRKKFALKFKLTENSNELVRELSIFRFRFQNEVIAMLLRNIFVFF